MFQQKSHHHVPVLDGRRPVGMISASDILSLVYDIDSGDDRMLRTFLDIQFNIEDAMSTKLVTVTTDAKVREVADAMSSGTIHSVLVVDGDGNLEGIVTSTDLIRLLGEML
jgi:CBS domain-containing protein